MRTGCRDGRGGGREAGSRRAVARTRRRRVRAASWRVAGWARLAQPLLAPCRQPLGQQHTSWHDGGSGSVYRRLRGAAPAWAAPAPAHNTHYPPPPAAPPAPSPQRRVALRLAPAHRRADRVRALRARRRAVGGVCHPHKGPNRGVLQQRGRGLLLDARRRDQRRAHDARHARRRRLTHLPGRARARVCAQPADGRRQGRLVLPLR